jgi:flagella basal body P-ring formation protein FlgA
MKWRKTLGKFSTSILFLMISITSAYSLSMETVQLEEKVRNFAQNYFDIATKNQFKREIFLTVSLIPPRDIRQLKQCATPLLLNSLQNEDSSLLKINVSCSTQWSALYLARAMYRFEENQPWRAFSSKAIKQTASSPQPTEYLVKKGQELEFVARGELVEIRSSVIAEENGRLGDVIWVRNKRSGKKIPAQVSSEQEVSAPKTDD